MAARRLNAIFSLAVTCTWLAAEGARAHESPACASASSASTLPRWCRFQNPLILPALLSGLSGERDVPIGPESLACGLGQGGAVSDPCISVHVLRPVEAVLDSDATNATEPQLLLVTSTYFRGRLRGPREGASRVPGDLLVS